MKNFKFYPGTLADGTKRPMVVKNLGLYGEPGSNTTLMAQTLILDFLIHKDLEVYIITDQPDKIVANDKYVILDVNSIVNSEDFGESLVVFWFHDQLTDFEKELISDLTTDSDSICLFVTDDEHSIFEWHELVPQSSFMLFNTQENIQLALLGCTFTHPKTFGYATYRVSPDTLPVTICIDMAGIALGRL